MFKEILLFVSALTMFQVADSYYDKLNEYTDFSNTAVEKISSDDTNNVYEYKTTLTNTGEGYILLEQSYLTKNNSYISSYLTSKNCIDDVLIPGQSVDLVFTSSYDTDPATLSLNTYAYTEFAPDDAVSIESWSLNNKYGYISFDENDVATTTYMYSFSYELNLIDDSKSYAGIFEVEIQGTSHYFMAYYLGNYLSIELTDNIAADSFNIKGVKALERGSSDTGSYYLSIIEKVIGVIGISILIAIGGGAIAGLVIATIFIVKAIKKKKALKEYTETHKE